MKIKGLLLLVLPFMVMADISDDNQSKIFPSLYIAMETGQIVRGMYRDFTVDHLWLFNVIGRAGLTAVPKDWLTLNVGLEGRLWYNTWPEEFLSNSKMPLDPYYSFYLHEAHGIFSTPKDNPLVFDATVGFFPYKYNDQARDLGEYLFRGNIYPVYIASAFDFAMIRLAGSKLSLHYTSPNIILDKNLFSANANVLLLTEWETRPFYDFSFAGLLNVNVLEALTIGAGINLSRIFPVDEEKTTPKEPSNVMKVDTLETDSTGWPTKLDTSYYTYAGTKVMFRSTIDPVFFLRGKEGFLGDLFGEHGLKIYGEIGIFGLENYEANEFTNLFGYTNIKDRMPKMFGFTLPMWKILDIFAVEFEHCSSPDPNDRYNAYINGVPTPVMPKLDAEYDTATFAKDSWKFAIYAKKSIGENVGFIFQAARDHQTWEGSGIHWQQWDFGDALVKWSEWAWHFKIEYLF